MSCCDNTIQCQRDADFQAFYLPQGDFSFTDLTPQTRIWGTSGSAASPALTLGLIQSVNGSAWSHADENLALLIKQADLDSLPDETLYYDTTLTDLSGIVHPFDGGVLDLYPDGSTGGCNTASSLRVALDGQQVPVIIQSGGLGVSMSLQLSELNQAVADAQTAEQGAIDAEAAAVAATVNKADIDFANTALPTATGGTFVGNQLSAGSNLRTQSYQEFVQGGALMPSQFAGTAEQQFKRAITEAATFRNGQPGGTVQLPRGEFEINTAFNADDRVSTVGFNKRGTAIKALGTFSGSWMATAVNGTTSMFDNALERLTLNANHKSGLGGLLSSAMQEGGGLNRVLIEKFTTTGFRLQDGFGGAALCEVNQSEIMGSNQIKANIGIDMAQIKLSGAFCLGVSMTTIAGSPQTGGAVDQWWLSKGINAVNDSTNLRVVHFEQCTTGLYINGNGRHVLENVHGLATVSKVVEIDAGFLGTLDMTGCMRDGSALLLKDNRPKGYGDVAYDTDIRWTTGMPANLGDVIADFTFNGSTLTYTGFGVAGIARTASPAGEWIVTLAWTLKSVDHMNATCNGGNDINGVSRVMLNTANSVKVRHTSFGSTFTDTSEIMVRVTRKRLEGDI